VSLPELLVFLAAILAGTETGLSAAGKTGPREAVLRSFPFSRALRESPAVRGWNWPGLMIRSLL
jgi:hypothetical protein